MGDVWHKFILQLDILMEESLRLCVKVSLQTFMQLLHGDGTTGPSPIIGVSLNLVDNKVLNFLLYEKNF